jgi:nicotinamidase-related amidase
MATELRIEAGRTAVLSLDLQAGIVSQYAKEDKGLIPRVAGILAEARKAGATVVHVRVGFRRGLPEVSARNVLFGAIKDSPQWQKFFAGEAGEVHPGVRLQETDIIVTKHRVDALFGTDLEMILRAKEIDTLILFGIATSGVVLSTLLHASDADYRIIVVKDCCIDQDAEVHNVLMEKIFSRRANVVTVEKIRALLAQG